MAMMARRARRASWKKMVEVGGKREIRRVATFLYRLSV